MTHDQEIERQLKERSRRFRKVFGTPDGKQVLEDLKAMFLVEQRVFILGGDNNYHPIHAAMREGRRDAYFEIGKVLAAYVDSGGDDEPEKTKPTVKS